MCQAEAGVMVVAVDYRTWADKAVEHSAVELLRVHPLCFETIARTLPSWLSGPAYSPCCGASGRTLT